MKYLYVLFKKHLGPIQILNIYNLNSILLSQLKNWNTQALQEFQVIIT